MDWADRQLSRLQERRLLAPVIVVLLLGLQLLLMDKKAEWGIFPGVALLAVALAYRSVLLLWLTGVALMPLSVNLDHLFPGIGLTLPSDLLAVALLLLAFFKVPLQGQLAGKIIRHPITILLGLFLLWMGLTIIPSSMPVVSLKFWLNSLWYATGFFLFSLIAFRKWETLRGWLWFVAPALGFVLLYSLVNHAARGFSFNVSYVVMQPFYKEHTVYGASIAFFLPGYLVMALNSRIRSWGWLLGWGMSLLVLAGIVVSYTRGAWLGVILALGLWVSVHYWKWLRYPALAVAVLIAVFAFKIFFDPETEVRAESSQDRSLTDHFVTAFDIDKNLSNKERINRWVAAWGMLRERPVFGFGPGTYAFKYAPYQQALFRTYVSTNQGDVGTAHSELMLALSEMGWVGGLLLLSLMITSVVMGIRGYRRAQAPWRRGLYAAAFAGLTTYYVHGLVNNYLDQDKVAIPFFLSLAVIVALDTLHPERPQPPGDHHSRSAA